MTEDTRSGKVEPPVSGADIRTFLIADVRGYSRFTDQQGNEAGARLAARFEALSRDVVGQTSGRIVDVRGDEVAAEYSSPSAALRSAILLQKRCAVAMREDASIPLSVGVGVDVGEAVPVGEGYRGGALNRAARLCAAAAGGEVLLSEVVHHLAGPIDDATYSQPRRLRLKGIAEPVAVRRLVFDLGVPAEPTAGRRNPRRLIAGTAIVAVLVAAGAIWAVSESTEGRSAGLRVPFNRVVIVKPTATSGRIVATIPLAQGVGGASYGDGHAWLADGEGVLPVKVATLKAQRPIPLPGGAQSTAYVDGQLWATSNTPGDAAVYEIAPQTRSVSQRLPVPGASGVLVGGDDAVWVYGELLIARIDPRDPADVRHVPIGVGQHRQFCAIAFTRNAMWVADAAVSPPGSVRPGALVMVNPTMGRILHEAPILQTSQPYYCVRAAAGAIWVTNTGPRIFEYNPTTGAYAHTLRIGREGSIGWLAGTPSGLWVLLNHPSRLVELSPAGTVIRRIRITGSPLGFDAYGGYLWIAYGNSGAPYGTR